MNRIQGGDLPKIFSSGLVSLYFKNAWLCFQVTWSHWCVTLLQGRALSRVAGVCSLALDIISAFMVGTYIS